MNPILARSARRLDPPTTRRTAALLSVLVSLLAAACGGGDDTSTSPHDGGSGAGGDGPGTGGSHGDADEPAVGTGGSRSGVGGATMGTGGFQSGVGGSGVGTGGSAMGTGGGIAGTGGSTVGIGGSAVATGGSAVGTGGATFGAGGSTVGTGGSVVATGGSAVGAGGAVVGTGGSVVATGGRGQGLGGSPGSGGRGSGLGGSFGSGGNQVGGGEPGLGGSAGSGGTSSGAGGSDPGLGGSPGTGGDGQEDPVCDVPPASEHQVNLSVGAGSAPYAESDHFVLFGASRAGTALNILEGAHQCFVEDWCWRSPGLSVHSDDGPFYKFNVYSEANLSAGGYMQYDAGAGLAYIEVLASLIDNAGVSVHEYGHALTLTAYGWVDQKNTGFWWESVANFVADTFITSPFCENARSTRGIAEGESLIELDTVIGRSYWTICMNQNYYQAWPFLTYLTNNPDGYPGLGRMVLPDLFENHQGNNETPLHVLERLASPVTVQAILGRYWARMAYLDIEHPRAQAAFFDSRARLNFDNLTSVGNGLYEPVAGREPRYGGANIVPLDVGGDGTVSVQVTNLGNGLPESNFVATLSIRGADGSVRYVDLPEGSGQATVGSSEEASLVVVNAPDELYMYDPEFIDAEPSSDPANTALNYQVQITGAAPAG